MKRVLLILLAVTLVVGIAGTVVVGPKAWRWYQAQQREALSADAVSTPTIAGQTAYIAANDQAGPRRLMLFAHGHSADHEALTLLRLHDWAQGLVDDGWIVATSDAHGDAWGSQASQDDYAALYEHVAGEYEVAETVLVSESMGAIPALQLAASETIPTLVGWVGVSPVVDVDAALASDELGGLIRDESDEEETARMDPADLSPAKFDGLGLLVVAAEDDETVPPETAEVFAEEYGADLATCRGGHVAEDCYDDLDLGALIA